MVLTANSPLFMFAVPAEKLNNVVFKFQVSGVKFAVVLIVALIFAPVIAKVILSSTPRFSPPLCR